jgi:hypothetical protein
MNLYITNVLAGLKARFPGLEDAAEKSLLRQKSVPQGLENPEGNFLLAFNTVEV